MRYKGMSAGMPTVPHASLSIWRRMVDLANSESMSHTLPNSSTPAGLSSAPGAVFISPDIAVFMPCAEQRKLRMSIDDAALTTFEAPSVVKPTWCCVWNPMRVSA